MPPPERQPADPGRADDAARRREAERVRRMVDVAPRATALDAHAARLRIDADAAHRRQVDDQAVVAQAQAPAVVAPAAHGEQQPVLAREAHRRDDVGHVGTAGDQARTLGDHRVEDRARSVVRGIAGLDEGAAQLGAVAREVGVAEHEGSLPWGAGHSRRRCAPAPSTGLINLPRTRAHAHSQD
jgi:hypothetical protein